MQNFTKRLLGRDLFLAFQVLPCWSLPLRGIDRTGSSMMVKPACRQMAEINKFGVDAELGIRPKRNSKVSGR